MGRHSDKRRRRGLIAGIVAAAVALVLVAGGGVAWATGYIDVPLPGAASPQPSCKQTPMSVVADPSIAPVLTKIAKAFDAKNPCVKTTVRTEDSADTASVIASGGNPKADVWIPDSAAWSDRMGATAGSLGRPAPVAAFGDPIATTPVVFAAPADQAEAFTAGSVGWSSILGGTVSALLPDPEGSAASLLALGALQAHAPAGDTRTFAGAMIALGKTIPRSLDAAMASAEKAATPTVVITTEHSVVTSNAASPDDQFFALYPADGTSAASYPYVRVAGLSAATVGLDTAVGDFEKTLRDSGKTFAKAGFRGPDGSGDISAPGIVKTPDPLQPAAEGTAQLAILRSWSVLTLRSRMLAVVDVSGSMSEPTASGLRRIDIFQQAAMGALQKFSGEVELGIWDFSTNRVGTQDWEDLTPIAPLGDAQHAQDIANIIAGLPARLGGATGLYDTTLAAVQRVQETYDPSKVNSVLLITDGKNEDDNGISLDDLLAKLQATEDPKKPVPVIFIGFGPDTDLDAMTRIAKVTGGAAYSASKPEDLGNVLVDALSQRTCRPNCP